MILNHAAKVRKKIGLYKFLRLKMKITSILSAKTKKTPKFLRLGGANGGLLRACRIPILSHLSCYKFRAN